MASERGEAQLDRGPTNSPLGWWQWFLPGPRTVLGLVLFGGLLCRVLWLSEPSRALIFDEKYYVNAARIILGRHVAVDAPYHGEPAGLDPNREHPPLGKVLIAGSMRLFGDTPIGWRLPSILTGLASILLVYAVARAAAAEQWLATLAAALFSLDNLVLVHSRIATLDMPLLAFLLLGSWFALRRQPFWAGIACALATLVKIVGLYGLLALLLLLVFEGVRTWQRGGVPLRPMARSAAVLVVAFLGTWLIGLWLLDHFFSVFPTPWDHLRYMLHYGLTLTTPNGPSGIESYPWQWLINEVQIPYLRVDQIVKAHGQTVASHPEVYFRGAMNPVIIGIAPLAFSYSVWRAWCIGDTLSLWVVAWVIGMYLPFFPLVGLEHRVGYIYYFLPTIPAVTISLAQLLRQSTLPRPVLWSVLLAVAVGFVSYFPFRTLL